MTSPKFKIGDRVKWAHLGKSSFGFVRARISEGWWKVEYKAGCMESFHESGFSLDVPAEPKFKIGDRVKWVWGRIGVIAEVHEDNRYSFKTPLGWASKVPGDHLSLDVPEAPKFKIGDRVKWDQRGRTGVVIQGHAGNRYSLETALGCLAEIPGDHLSLDVPEAHKFKIGDRVKFARFVIGAITLVGADDCYSIDSGDRCISKIPGADLSREVPGLGAFKVGDYVKYVLPSGNIGLIIQGHAENHYSVQTGDGCVTRVPGSQMSLDVPEPKQFATKLEAELGAEIIRLNFQIADQKKMSSVQAKGRMEDREQIKNLADLDSRLTKEIGAGHRERIAKEAAQQELAQARKDLNSVRDTLADVCDAMRVL